MQKIHFAVYEHKLITEEKRIIKRNLIVLKDETGFIVRFTDFHRYAKCPNRSARRITETGGTRCKFICRFLNYIFFEKYHIQSLKQITKDMVEDFLNKYGTGCLPNDTKKRTKGTIDKCAMAVLDFLTLYTDRNKGAALKKNDLVKQVTIRSKNGQITKKMKSNVEYIYDSEEKTIFRDMPEKVFFILFDLILKNHKEILMLVATGAFAGLRPSESCNVRREDADPPGLIITRMYGTTNPAPDGGNLKNLTPDVLNKNRNITSVSIDLRKERVLRSDGAIVGGIKKERWQNVYPAFLPLFGACYEIYMKYIEGRYYEADYAPLTINGQSKAYTYESYRRNFRKVIAELIPVLLEDEDPEVVNFGHMINEYNIGPHIFRHWFTVQLILHGETNPAALQNWRGDKSPESALVYLSHKEDLEKKYKKVSNEMSDYMMWKAKKLYGE